MIDSSTLQGTSFADVIGIASWNNIKIKISFIWGGVVWSVATIFITPRQKLMSIILKHGQY